jgi:hypothetical protein
MTECPSLPTRNELEALRQTVAVIKEENVSLQNQFQSKRGVHGNDIMSMKESFKSEEDSLNAENKHLRELLDISIDARTKSLAKMTADIEAQSYALEVLRQQLVEQTESNAIILRENTALRNQNRKLQSQSNTGENEQSSFASTQKRASQPKPREQISKAAVTAIPNYQMITAQVYHATKKHLSIMLDKEFRTWPKDVHLEGAYDRMAFVKT